MNFSIYSMACVRYVALAVNCGYARVCIYQNSNPQRTGPNARQAIDKTKRETKFRDQFSGTYFFPEGYFSVIGRKGLTQFNRDCDKVLDGFKSKFPVRQPRESYLDTFSHSELPVAERKQHSLGKCGRCFELHKDSQLSFPLKPCYHHKPILSIDEDALQRLGLKKFTSGVMEELNRVYESRASTSFADAVVSTSSSGLEKKKSQSEKRKEKVKVQKEITKAVNEHFAEKAAISMLTENVSKRKYHRKRMHQSFHSPQEQPAAKKSKSHSPNFSNVTWDKEKLRETLETGQLM